MTQEEKDLLLKDLCARIPYGVKFACNKNVYTAKGIDLIVTDEGDWEYAVTAKGIAPIEIDFIKPYLRPLSSMTEVQYDEWCNLIKEPLNEILTRKESDEKMSTMELQSLLVKSITDSVNYCYKNNFDINNLIPKGRAIDATNLNIY